MDRIVIVNIPLKGVPSTSEALQDSTVDFVQFSFLSTWNHIILDNFDACVFAKFHLHRTSLSP